MGSTLNTVGYILCFGIFLPSSIVCLVGIIRNKEKMVYLSFIVMLVSHLLLMVGGLIQGGIRL